MRRKDKARFMYTLRHSAEVHVGSKRRIVAGWKLVCLGVGGKGRRIKTGFGNLD